MNDVPRNQQGNESIERIAIARLDSDEVQSLGQVVASYCDETSSDGFYG
jgi:hypothetical protein